MDKYIAMQENTRLMIWEQTFTGRLCTAILCGLTICVSMLALPFDLTWRWLKNDK